MNSHQRRLRRRSMYRVLLRALKAPPTGKKEWRRFRDDWLTFKPVEPFNWKLTLPPDHPDYPVEEVRPTTPFGDYPPSIPPQYGIY